MRFLTNAAQVDEIEVMQQPGNVEQPEDAGSGLSEPYAMWRFPKIPQYLIGNGQHQYDFSVLAVEKDEAQRKHGHPDQELRSR